MHSGCTVWIENCWSFVILRMAYLIFNIMGIIFHLKMCWTTQAVKTETNMAQTVVSLWFQNPNVLMKLKQFHPSSLYIAHVVFHL